MEFRQDPQEQSGKLINSATSRRHMLGVLGVGLAGLALAPADALAATTGMSAERIAAWNRFMAEYAAYLSRQRFRYISVRQVVEAHMKSRGLVHNTPPPRSMWRNLVPTLRVADRIAYELRSPLRDIVSAYRSPSYNALCPGARRESMHTKNLAVDIQFNASPKSVAMVAEKLRKKGYFRGGIGRYSSFTHIDTRGENVDWCA